VDLASNGKAGRQEVVHALKSGAGRQALRRMVEAQGGDTRAFDERSRLPTAVLKQPVLADSDGYLSRLDALTVARASILLGAGRERKGDAIDLAVGVYLEAKLGDRVARGQPIAVLHANDASRLGEAERVLRGGIALSATPVEAPPVILERPGASTASRA
jgi:pyrimidine-nucleoside phosphorylase